MLFTTHAVTGATIGILTGNPLLGFGAAIFSHHFLDSLPHFDQGSFYMDKDNGPCWAGAKYEYKGKKFKNRRDWIILFADWSVSGAIFLYLFFNLPINYWQPIFLGALAGLLPDIMDVSPFWKDKFRATRFGRAYHEMHEFFHWPMTKKYWIFGLGIQIAIIAADFLFIKKFFI